MRQSSRERFADCVRQRLSRHRGRRPCQDSGASLATRFALIAALAVLPSCFDAAAFEMFAATPSDKLVRFDSATPGSTSVAAISGLPLGEIVVGIAFRQLDQKLYALTNGGSGGTSNLYTIDPATGAATLAVPLGAILSGSKFGMRFIPTVDRLRVVSDSGQNLRINPATGGIAVDTPLSPGTPHVVAIAYDNAFAHTAATTLYDIDSNDDTLYIQSNPNGGTLVPVGALGVDTADAAGFDILSLGSGDVAYATLSVGGTTRLYTIVLQTGVAGFVGNVFGDPTLISLAIRPEIIFKDGFD